MKKNYIENPVKISKIQLDQENPRFPPVNNQREAIQAMLKDQGTKIVNLASDIYQNGLNPSSKLILFKEGSKFIDGDGNRRVTALKILETPSLSDSDPKIRKRIDTILKAKGTIPSEVDCVIFDSREAAKHWISINHSGPQEGKGQISWDSEQKNRFEGNFTIGLQALDLLTYRSLITAEDKLKVNKTTLDRLLSYKQVKEKLVISKSDDHFLFENINNLKKIVLALRDEKVDAVYTAAKGIAFVNGVLNSDSGGFDKKHGNTEPNGNTDNMGDYHNTGRQSESKGDSDAENQSDNRNTRNDEAGPTSPRTRRQDAPKQIVFGGALSLGSGHINNLYRDIEQIYNVYKSKKMTFSDDFIVIFRMSLRMLAETAARDANKDLKNYLTENFDQAKQSLDKNTKTLLSNQSVEKGKVVQLFQTGAHDYANSRNEEQAIALSIILGGILRITHGKKS
ncbi:hypothetical protein [Methylobacillus sp.]|uniref:hypothetical protein n=1 Tax=Methylobacillus sp. TaxID=56818 RepID=UPI002FE3BB9C